MRNLLKKCALVVALTSSAVSSNAFEPEHVRVAVPNLHANSGGGPSNMIATRIVLPADELFCGVHFLPPKKWWNGSVELWEIQEHGLVYGGGAGTGGAGGDVDIDIMLRYVNKKAIPKDVDWRTACTSDGFQMPAPGRDNIKITNVAGTPRPPMHGCFNGVLWRNNQSVGSC